MKRAIVLFCLMLSITNLAIAQAQEGTVRYKKAEQPAAVIELPYPPDIIIEAMNEYLSKKGKSKATDIKGFKTFRNTEVLSTKTDNADLYFKIERKSRQDKETSFISLLLTQPKDQEEADKNLHYLNMEQAKTYLNELVPAIAAYNLEQNIIQQNKNVITAEAKHKDHKVEGEDLNRKKIDLEQRITQNNAQQQAHQATVETEKQKLAQLVSQRIP
ncbi:MAG TPA: hypothetical protein PL009_04750 [Flavipsychrobacter sp.]|nr:hypothetical protein [Flavipsychrobacter sp.]